MTTLKETMPLLAEAYGNWKTWGEAKDRYKEEFFELANQALEQRVPAKSVFVTAANTIEAARKRAVLHNPGWIMGETDLIGDKSYACVLTEDPAYQPFSFDHEGYRYARQIAKGAVMVDDEWLAEADEKLYAKVTYELPWGARITRPIEALDATTIGALTRYLYPGKPRVSLSVRPVKDESA